MTGTLDRLTVALERLGDRLSAVREAVALDNPSLLLDASAAVEESAALVAHLEAERQQIQRRLERRLGVQGLPAVAALSSEIDETTSLQARLDEIRLQVRHLQDEEARTATLLTSAIELAQRTRAYLTRLRGVDAPYGPPTPPVGTLS